MPTNEPLVNSIIDVTLNEDSFKEAMTKLSKLCDKAAEIAPKLKGMAVTANMAEFNKQMASAGKKIKGLQNALNKISAPKIPKVNKLNNALAGGAGGSGGAGNGTPQTGPAGFSDAQYARTVARLGEVSRETSKVRQSLIQLGRGTEIEAVNNQLEIMRLRLRRASSDSELITLQNVLRGLRIELSQVNQQARLAKENFDRIARADIGRVRNQMKDVNRSILQARIEADRFPTILRNIVQARFTKLQDAVQRFGSRLQRVRKILDPKDDRVQRIRKQFDLAANRARLFSFAVRGLSAAFSILGPIASSVLSGITNGLVRGSRAVASFNFNALRIGFQSVLFPLTSIVSSLRRIVQFAPELAAAFALREVRASLTEFATFDDTIRRAVAEFRIFGAESDRVRSQFRGLASEVGVESVQTQNEIAEALVELGRAGFAAGDVTKRVLKDVADFALSANLELDKSVGLLSQTSSQFALSADEFERVGEVLTAASNLAANTKVADLAPGFANVASSAITLGLQIEEIAAALVTARQRGQQLSQVGTSISTFARVFRTALRDPSARQGLGTRLLSQIDSLAQQAGKSLEDVVDTGNRTLAPGGIGELIELSSQSKELQELLEVLVGARGFRLNLLFGSSDRFKNNLNQINQSAGLTRRRVEAIEGSLLSLGKIIGGIRSAIRINLLDPISKDLASALGVTRKSFESLNDFIEGQLSVASIIQLVSEGVQSVAAALIPVLERFSRLAAVVNLPVFQALGQLATRTLPLVEDYLDRILIRLEELTGLTLTGDIASFVQSLEAGLRTFDFESFAGRLASELTIAFSEALNQTFLTITKLITPVTSLIGKAIGIAVLDFFRGSDIGRIFGLDSLQDAQLQRAQAAAASLRQAIELSKRLSKVSGKTITPADVRLFAQNSQIRFPEVLAEKLGVGLTRARELNKEIDVLRKSIADSSVAFETLLIKDVLEDNVRGLGQIGSRLLTETLRVDESVKRVRDSLQQDLFNQQLYQNIINALGTDPFAEGFNRYRPKLAEDAASTANELRDLVDGTFAEPISVQFQILGIEEIQNQLATVGNPSGTVAQDNTIASNRELAAELAATRKEVRGMSQVIASLLDGTGTSALPVEVVKGGFA